MLGRIPQHFFGRGLLQLDFDWRILHDLIFSKVSRIAACLGFVDLCDYTHCLPLMFATSCPTIGSQGRTWWGRRNCWWKSNFGVVSVLHFHGSINTGIWSLCGHTRSFHIHMLSPAPDVLPLRPFVSAKPNPISKVCVRFQVLGWRLGFAKVACPRAMKYSLIAAIVTGLLASFLPWPFKYSIFILDMVLKVFCWVLAGFMFLLQTSNIPYPEPN